MQARAGWGQHCEVLNGDNNSCHLLYHVSQENMLPSILTNGPSSSVGAGVADEGGWDPVGRPLLGKIQPADLFLL